MTGTVDASIKTIGMEFILLVCSASSLESLWILVAAILSLAHLSWKLRISSHASSCYLCPYLIFHLKLYILALLNRFGSPASLRQVEK